MSPDAPDRPSGKKEMIRLSPVRFDRKPDGGGGHSVPNAGYVHREARPTPSRLPDRWVLYGHTTFVDSALQRALATTSVRRSDEHGGVKGMGRKLVV